jgi:ATP-dependent protease ClpP protease subunit
MSEKQAAKSWNVALRSVGEEELEVSVYDVIGSGFFADGVTAKDVLAKLRSAPNAKKISLRVNSIGGIVDEAKAMVNLLTERVSKGVKLEATVDGIAASAASYLLTAASKVIMPANAFMMLHGVRGGAYGTASQMEATGALMRRLNDQLAEAYSAASARRGVVKTKDDYLASFAVGDLYLDADQAIEWGLADEKLEAVKVAACLADWDLLAADAPLALLSAPYLARAEAPAIQTPAPAAKDAALNQPITPRAAGQETRKKLMTEAELLAQFPAVHASLVAQGAAAERKRVNALLKLGTAYKAMDVANKAIAEGKSSMDEEVFADFQTANVNRLEAAARQADSDAAGAVLASAKAGKGAPAGAHGAAPVGSGEDGEDSDLLVAVADIFAGKKA